MLIVDATLWDGTGAEPRRGMALRTEGEIGLSELLEHAATVNRPW